MQNKKPEDDKDNKEVPEEKPMPTVTIQQAAIILNVHPNTIRSYIDKGLLKQYSLPFGKKILLYENDVKSLVQEKQPLHG